MHAWPAGSLADEEQAEGRGGLVARRTLHAKASTHACFAAYYNNSIRRPAACIHIDRSVIACTYYKRLFRYTPHLKSITLCHDAICKLEREREREGDYVKWKQLCDLVRAMGMLHYKTTPGGRGTDAYIVDLCLLN